VDNFLKNFISSFKSRVERHAKPRDLASAQATSQNVDLNFVLDTDATLKDPAYSGERVIIATHGRTAGHWLVAALNHHPNFLSTLSVFTVCWFHRRPPNEHERTFARQVTANMTIDEYFKFMTTFRHLPGDPDLEKTYPPRHLFSLHRYQISPLMSREMQEELYALGSGRPAIINLIRDPVHRLRSIAEQRYFDLTKTTDIQPHIEPHTQAVLEIPRVGEMREALKKRGVDVSDPLVRSYLCAFWTMYVEQEELKAPCWHIPSEKLAGEPVYFREIIGKLILNKTEIPDAYLDQIFSQKRIAGESTPAEGPIISSGEVFAEQLPWQRHITMCLDEEFDLASTYARFGYDLSFIRSQ